MSHTLTRPSAAPAGLANGHEQPCRFQLHYPCGAAVAPCSRYAVPMGATHSSCRSNSGHQFWGSLHFRSRSTATVLEDRDQDHWHRCQVGHAPGQLPLPKTSSCFDVIPRRTRCGNQVVVMQEDNAGHALLDRALHSKGCTCHTVQHAAVKLLHRCGCILAVRMGANSQQVFHHESKRIQHMCSAGTGS